jgi:glycine dehydrogenase subunit 2
LAEPYVFEISTPGRRGVKLPACDVPDAPFSDLIPPEHLRQDPPAFPELSELDVVRHFTRLSQQNFGIDTNFYPLGSCTMKYNPRVNEVVAGMPGFARVHPYTPDSLAQGVLALCDDLQRRLCGICGMDAFTLQPAAGAHGEALGMLLVRAYHAKRGHAKRRVLIPDSAHGTNPASAALVGYEATTVPSNANGEVDFEALRDALDDDVAALMLTNPNTLGVVETRVREIVDMVHDADGLVYYDGANLNAIVGTARPGDMGFDIVHLNLHKTFSTPHGGGGPGAGPVGVRADLEPFLPVPVVASDDGVYGWEYDRPQSVGRMRSFVGNFGILARAYTYIISNGADGLRDISRHAVLNANYILALLRDLYPPAVDRVCKHECVLSATALARDHGITATDVAKALLDHGYHAPTIYFPLPAVTPEAIMIEPTETESKETLDGFIAAMREIALEAAEAPERVKERPLTTPVRRLDEVTAARKPSLRWTADA